MKESLHAAAVQFGLLSEAGDKVNIVALCQAFEDMKLRCANMEMEVEDLLKIKATFDEMVRGLKLTSINITHQENELTKVWRI